MSFFEQIQHPVLLIDPAKTRRNIHFMVERARQDGVRLRPHFKTHQSAEIGRWFRDEGITACTVSSLQMAAYFARHGWSDLLVAFPVNLREIDRINQLAEQVQLQLLVESVETAAFLTEHLRHPVSVWIKVDCGYHRTGISYDDARQLNAVAEAVRNSGKMELLGLLTHGGDTYHAPDRAAVTARYQHSLERLLEAQRTLMLAGFSDLQLSVGDTPACSLVDSFGPVDEIRPGNFVFYDATQAMLGACQPDQISVALACPVVAKHAERSEVVIYGGAIHLSKDAHPYAAIPAAYGLAALQEDDSWGGALEGSYVRSLSQEHGVVRVNPYGFNRIQVGDLLFILPAHSCLTVQAMREMVTLEGTRITTMLSEERG